MKRLVGALAITIIILGLVSGILFYQNSELQKVNRELLNQNNEIQNQLYEQKSHNSELETEIVKLENQIQKLIPRANKITIIEFYYSRFTTYRVVHTFDLNIAIYNHGTDDVQNIVLAINFTTIELNFNKTIDIIHAGETINLNLPTGWGPTPEFSKTNILAKIYSEDLLLDEVTLISPFGH